MHYSQKRRYYFFIAIVKFKIILSYYPRWRKLVACAPLLILRHILGCASSLTFLRSTFAQPSLMIAPHLHHTCTTLAPHTLANFQSLPKLISSPPLAQACSLCPIQNSLHRPPHSTTAHWRVSEKFCFSLKQGY